MRGVAPSAAEIRTRFAAVKLTLLSEYHNARARVSVRCQRCRHVYDVLPYGVFQGQGCARCNKHQPAKLTQATIAKRLRQINVVPLEQYRGHVHRIKVRCCRCQHVWRVFPTSLFQGHGCSHCAWDTETRQRHSRSHRRAFRDPTIKRRHARAMRREETRCKMRVAWTTQRRQDQAEEQTLSAAEVKRRLHACRIRPLSCYRGAEHKIKVSCLVCGHVWTPYAGNLFNGTGCPRCRSHGGKTEAEVRSIVERVTGWKFPKARPSWLRGRSSHPLELDGYNLRHQIAFEYQGEQHYQPLYGKRTLVALKRNDQRKRDLCRYHGVLLICIPYWKHDVAAFVRAKLAAHTAA
jgi:hypothetical protein